MGSIPRLCRGGVPRLLAAAVLAFAGALALSASAAPSAEAQSKARPNIIVLLTDDQEPYSMRVMKTVRKQMERKGTRMSNFFMNFPLCCPARSTILTGEYAHNHQVLSNQAPDGGYGLFNELHGQNYLPIWLQNAGYTTGYIGKYMNEYAEPDEYGTTPRDVPIGWDDWRVMAPSRAQYFNYTLNQNGNLVHFDQEEEDYSTDVFTTKAKRFIRRNARAGAPFFLELGYAAPHGGGGGEPGRSCNRAAVPAPRHLGQLKKKNKFPLPPSFNEADVSDKPEAIQEIAPLTPGQISDVTRKRRCAWESLLAVDESVGEIVAEVKRDKIRRNTYVFFLSDNGYLRGEHRIRNNKRFLYEESARVPFVARGPGIARGEKSEDVVTNADLTATVLELTGAAPGLTQDGQSLMPSLANPEAEHGRAILHEAYAGQQILGVRTSRYLYTEWDTDLPLLPDIELYDNYADPYQLNNLASNPAYAGVVNDLADELDDLIDCAGADCRGVPSANLAINAAATGPKSCVISPVVARVSSPSENEVVSVSFEVDDVAVGEDTVAPFELTLPEGALRRALRQPPPKAAEVVAKVLYVDGRRLGLTAKVRGCA